MYIDREDAQVVRMAFNFTHAAFLDAALEDLFVVIENSLVNSRFWLPRQQEIEIRRGGTWLDYPIRGIIRGRWVIGDYQINTGFLPRDLRWSGARSRAARRCRTPSTSAARILDSLPPDVRAVTNADIKRVQEEARALVRAQALRRPQALALSAVGASDFVRFDRAEGFAFGAGVSSRFGGGFGVEARGRYGIDDRLGKGSGTLAWRSPKWGVRLFGQSDFRDAGDIQERSILANSIAAQEFGSTTPIRTASTAPASDSMRSAFAASGCTSTRRSNASGRYGCAPLPPTDSSSRSSPLRPFAPRASPSPAIARRRSPSPAPRSSSMASSV